MKPIDLAFQIANYFNLTLTDSNIKRVESMCQQFADSIPVREKTIIRYKAVNAVLDVDFEYRSLDDIAKVICEKFGIGINDLIKIKKNGRAGEDIALIRAEFSSLAHYTYRHSKKGISRFLKVHHTTVLHYLNNMKQR